ncbi:MAG: TIGR04219 family outer membrane beta-barrel protein [Gammaproteobacteria bacterium]|nr:TIGR04219 family outer membrane beta-barrel protein [Gammaproteobacteria bacterium]
MTLKHYFTSAVLSFFLISISHADTLAFRVGGGIWQPDASGTFRHGGTENIDLKKDLFLKDGENQNYVYALLEHPIPFIPNIKLSQTALTLKGAGTVTGAGYTFSGTNYAAGTPVTTSMVLDHSDTTVYYSMLDNWFHLDLGLTAKKFDGSLSVTSGGTTETTNIDKTIPLLYVNMGIEIPFIEDLFFGVEANVLNIGDHTIQDIVTKVSYTTSYFVGFEAGIRTFTVEMDKLNGNTSNMEFTGQFANVFIHF